MTEAYFITVTWPSEWLWFEICQILILHSLRHELKLDKATHYRLQRLKQGNIGVTMQKENSMAWVSVIQLYKLW